MFLSVPMIILVVVQSLSRVPAVVKKKKKKKASQCRRVRRPGFDPWAGKVSWRRKWQPTPVFVPGEFHGQGSLEGYSP